MRKTKAKVEFNLARDTKNHKKDFYSYINQKEKVKKLVTTDEEKVEVLNFYASVFNGNLCRHTSRVDKPYDGN
ncbi:hypothetical protein WISP_22364 [Willisornis vidua]|uniref:Uncharacterized protein n=1 Tax=Willisornis vidua TaxID=1566151 RepID=A0ABQ9DTI7_9PASS|nr:hypothetical protein WISP_22364 [Willisornis vidua]